MKKNIVIIGTGTAGTMTANKLVRELPQDEWEVTVIDKDFVHYYQPGFLFIPFGIYQPEDVVKPKKQFLPKEINYIIEDVDGIDPSTNKISLKNGTALDYDLLVIATGSDIAPEETDGLLNGGWHKNIFDFYSFSGAVGLSKALERFEEGRIVVNIAELPFKCPVAPLEFVLLADWYFTERGIRDKVELVYSTPLSGAFTKPVANHVLNNLLAERNIIIEADYNIMEVDSSRSVITSYDERDIEYDLLVEIPTNMGAEFIGDSGLGDELNFVPTDKYTLRSKKFENIFVIGDASDVPTSKAGSVAHFMLDTLVENMKQTIKGQPLVETFDGHANCFVETGYGKAILIDFNYDTQPLLGKFPFSLIGPMDLLKETRLNHIGKLAFKYIYWNLLLKALPIPFIPHHMSMAGKVSETKTLQTIGANA